MAFARCSLARISPSLVKRQASIGALHMVQCDEAFGSSGLAPVTPRLAQPAAIAGRKGADDRPGDFVLDREDIRQLPVVGLGPKLPVLGAVDELHRDADAVAGFLNTSLQNVANRKFTRRLSRRHRRGSGRPGSKTCR